jgi:hypothetical protein
VNCDERESVARHEMVSDNGDRSRICAAFRDGSCEMRVSCVCSLNSGNCVGGENGKMARGGMSISKGI